MPGTKAQNKANQHIVQNIMNSTAENILRIVGENISDDKPLHKDGLIITRKGIVGSEINTHRADFGGRDGVFSSKVDEMDVVTEYKNLDFYEASRVLEILINEFGDV